MIQQSDDRQHSKSGAESNAVKPSLLDTDTLSFYLRGHQSVVASVTNYLSHFNVLSFSIITYYEILSGLLRNDAQKQL